MASTSVSFNAVARGFISNLILVDFFHGNGNDFVRIDVDQGFIVVGQFTGAFGSRVTSVYLLSTFCIKDSRVGLINIVHLS